MTKLDTLKIRSLFKQVFDGLQRMQYMRDHMYWEGYVMDGQGESWEQYQARIRRKYKETKSEADFRL